MSLATDPPTVKIAELQQQILELKERVDRLERLLERSVPPHKAQT